MNLIRFSHKGKNHDMHEGYISRYPQQNNEERMNRAAIKERRWQPFLGHHYSKTGQFRFMPR